MLSPVFTSSIGLYQALQHAAAHAPEDQIVHSLPDWRPADEGEEPEVYLLHTACNWSQPKIPAKTGVIAMHGPQRHGVGKLSFTFNPSPGVRSSFNITGTRPKLLAMAEQVRKHWALYGGGPKPVVEKPVKRAVTWSANVIKVWLAQIEDRDFAGAMLTAENLGAKYYPGNRDSVFVLAAPIQVDGLPDGMCSARRGDGRWTVSDMRTGGAFHARGFGSRKAAEEAALEAWQSKDDGQRAQGLQILASKDAADTAAARVAWCKEHGIEDPRRADDVQPDDAPCAPELADDAAAAPAAPVPAPTSGGSLKHPPAEAGVPPGVQKTQPDKPGGLPESGAVFVRQSDRWRAARAGLMLRRWRHWRSAAPPPVESAHIPPAEAGPGCTPWRAKDTMRWNLGIRPSSGGSLALRQMRARQGCGPPLARPSSPRLANPFT